MAGYKEMVQSFNRCRRKGLAKRPPALIAQQRKAIKPTITTPAGEKDLMRSLPK
jgi:hypothetical protein